MRAFKRIGVRFVYLGKRVASGLPNIAKANTSRTHRSSPFDCFSSNYFRILYLARRGRDENWQNDLAISAKNTWNSTSFVNISACLTFHGVGDFRW